MFWTNSSYEDKFCHSSVRGFRYHGRLWEREEGRNDDESGMIGKRQRLRRLKLRLFISRRRGGSRHYHMEGQSRAWIFLPGFWGPVSLVNQARWVNFNKSKNISCSYLNIGPILYHPVHLNALLYMSRPWFSNFFHQKIIFPDLATHFPSLDLSNRGCGLPPSHFLDLSFQSN